MREMEVYKTPASGKSLLPSDAICRSALPLAISHVEDWLKPAFAKQLRNQGIELLDAAVLHAATGKLSGQAIDTEIFVSRLTDTIGKLRAFFYRDLTKESRTRRELRRELNAIAAEQGFKGFVDDIDYAIAGQIGYRLIGQILFYFALRRKIPNLKEIKLEAHDIYTGRAAAILERSAPLRLRGTIQARSYRNTHPDGRRGAGTDPSTRGAAWNL